MNIILILKVILHYGYAFVHAYASHAWLNAHAKINAVEHGIYV